MDREGERLRRDAAPQTAVGIETAILQKPGNVADRMKAAVLHQIGQPLGIEDIPAPELGADEVLIETRTCGICRTDLHLQQGLAYVPTLPHVPGHEPAGVVIDVGSRVSGCSVGQRVVPHLFLCCGECRYCRSGRDAQCTRVGGILGVTCHGGFAQYFKAPARNIIPLPEAVPFDVGGLVSCAAITAVHAYRRARLSVGDTVVILGAGGIGQILIQILVHAGLRVVAWSRSPLSLEIAERLGAGLCLHLDDAAAIERLAEFSGGDGPQAVFECVGTAHTMKLACDSLMPGGQVIVIGEEPEAPGVDTITIAQRELEILGSRNGSRQDAVDAVAMLALGIIKPPIAARFPLDQINEAFRLVESGQSHGRVVIDVTTE